MIRISALVAAFSFAALCPTTSHAGITQQIVFIYDDDFNPANGDVSDDDRIDGQTDADIDRALIAGISGEGFNANGSVGEFGTYGLTGETTNQGELDAQVFISADVSAPPFGTPRPAETLFIIDGGISTSSPAPCRRSTSP